MSFENFERLTGASLLTSPTINSFFNIQLNPKKVKRGDLFIGDDIKDIQEALSLDAYAIVSSKDVEIYDHEIAWFRVDSIEKTLVKLLRFSLLEKDFRFIYAKDIEFEFIKKIVDKKDAITLDGDKKDIYQKIINASKNNIFFSKDENFLRDIYPNYESIKTVKDDIFNNIKKGLFLTSFTYNEKFYKNIKLPSIFLKNFENVIHFLQNNRIKFEISKLSFTPHFYPIFIDAKAKIQPFGKSEKVIICEINDKLVNKELKYLKEEAPWAKSKIEDKKNIQKLKNIDFNFIIISLRYDKVMDELNSFSQENKSFFKE